MQRKFLAVMEMRNRKPPPEQDALEHIVTRRDKPFLVERFIDSFKGRGVFTQKKIKPHTFIVEYRGKIKNPGRKRKCDDILNNYLYEFSWKGAHWCIDASEEDTTLGRLVNDDHINPNSEIKKVEYEGKPHLCLFAVKEISPGEEITYDYGESSYPWRSRESGEGSSTSNTDFHSTTSTPRNKKLEATFCPEESCSDDDDDDKDEDELCDSGSSSEHGSDKDYKPEESALSSDEHGSDVNSEPDETALNSDQHGSVGDYVSNEDTQKPKALCRRLNYCYVCGKGMTKISRHLLRHVDEESDIAKAFAFPKNSKERHRMFNDLRNRGNYKHNEEVLRTNKGDLKPRRNSSTIVVSAKTYVHCSYCKGMFRRKDLWRHLARCPNKPPSPGKTALADSLLCEELSSDMKKILLKMKRDEIGRAVNNDCRLIQLAKYLSENCADNQKKHVYIRQRLRQMGRLLLGLREKSIFSLDEAIKPSNFYKVVETVRGITGFDEKRQKYKKTSLTLRLGQTLKILAKAILSGTDNNDEMVRDTKMFMKLCAEEWSGLVPQVSQVKSPSTIPFTQDVQALYKYLETTSASAIETMKMYESPQVYNALCRVILAQVSVLNKGAFEISKMTLKSFEERDETTQVLSKHFIRINTPGKSGQNAPVLLTSDLVSAITLLVSKRVSCGVHKDNPFLFAKPDGSDSSVCHGRTSINTFSSLCPAENPEYLRSMHFQKHITRIFQILNLENDELDHLAKLLGHDIRREKDYYRLPEAAVELAKIAKLLLAMEKGSLEKFKGNSLDEIEIEDILEPDVEQAYSENSDADKDNEESDLLPQQTDDAEQQDSQLTPEQDALDYIKACKDKPFLEAAFIDSFKGRGVFTHKSIEPSTFVVEYRGNISTREETLKNKCGDTLDNYSFDFSWNGTNWCIDASTDDGTIGRLVNDDHISPNCEMKKVVCEGKPHLCLFALKKIFAGEEITYNYGDSTYPWRATEATEKEKTPRTNINAAASSPRNETVEDAAESCCDDLEYVPDDDDPASEDDFTSGNNEKCQDSKNETESRSSKQQSIDDTSVQQEDADEKPSYTNRNYCFVCGKAQSKISRHLFTHRHENADIAQVFALPRKSKERKSRLQKLRNKGNSKHNEEVLKTRHGELKVRKRKSNLVATAKTFAPCIYCKIVYDHKNMWQHLRKCSLKTSNPLSGVCSKTFTLVTDAVTDLQKLSSDVKKMVKTLKEDEVSSVVWKDSYILLLAQCFLYKSEKKTIKDDYIRSKLRQMGRLLLILKKKAACSFEDAMKPQNFRKVVQAVRELTDFNLETQSCATPNLLLSLVSLVKMIGHIKYARVLAENADKEAIKEAETFLALCAKEWSSFSLSKLTATNAATIPFTHDVQLLYQLMEKTAASGVESLTMYESPPVYNALLRVTLAQVSVLNKNRSRISNVTLQSFKERQETDCQSNFAQTLHKRFVTIQVMSRSGKKSRDKTVTVMLTPEMLSAITLLVNKREACDVHANNPFLFARPDTTCTSFYHAQLCLNAFITRSGAKNPLKLRCPLFHKHVAKIFHILSFSNDELDQLSKLLECDIQTDREYYRKPEAAVDVAKILQLLSAMEKGTTERFQAKSLDEIEIEDELQPDIEQNNSESSDDEEENIESPLPESDIEDGTSTTQDEVTTSKGSFSTDERASFVNKPGRGRGRKQESESEASELSEDNNEELNTDNDDESEGMPVKCAEVTPSRSKEDATNISFSDDDDYEDMNVDFDIDIDTDEDVRNEDSDGGGDSAEVPMITDIREMTNQNKDISDSNKKDSSPDSHTTDAEENMDTDTENHVDNKDQDKVGEQSDWMDVDSGSSVILNTERKKTSAAVTGMKKVKILIPKLDIDKVKSPMHISQLSSLCYKSPMKEDLVQKNKHQTSTTTDISNKPSNAKDIEMTCSHCKKIMTKGQTAYKKKGFTSVFCSINCLFEMFPINRPATKTCHYCLKEITQLLDLIMAVVDIKGTMKDFCSVTCLTSFKSNTVSTQTPQSLCSTCKKSCINTYELTLNKVAHKFCSDTCLEGFRKVGMICVTCKSPCHNKLMLKLGEDTKPICSEQCVENFKENIMTPHPCTICHTSAPMSRMVVYKSSTGTVELFCDRRCVTSYKLGSAVMHKLQGSTLGESDNTAAAASDNTITLTSAHLDVLCCNCGKELLKGQTLYHLKSLKEVFCSASCVSERHPHITLVTKTCYNCFQVIQRPQNIISAPVDDSGIMKELCSQTCLASVQSRRSMTAPKPTPRLGPRSECRMCVRYCHCKFKLTLDGVVHRLCSDACFISYHRVNNLPLLVCDVCSSVDLDKRLVLKMEDGAKNVCSEECLVKFKEKVKTPKLCPMCQTYHQMSDMVENKNEDGSLNFFCSNRCMMVYKAPSFTVSEKSEPSPQMNDSSEVKPSLPHLDTSKIKEEPSDDEYKQSLLPSVSTHDIKDEPNVEKEDLKIGSVFSFKEDPAPVEPTFTHMDLPASCTSCKSVLMNGETVYQKKGHLEIFCSSSCLLKFYQIKPIKKTCHFCLDVITKPQDVVQAQLDAKGPVRDFCNQACLSSFNYMTFVSTKIPIVPVGAHSQCSICGRYCISKHEIILRNVLHKTCSDPCFRRLCILNKLSICENCQCLCNTPLILKTEDGNKKLCNVECLAQFKQNILTQQPCAMCHTSKLVAEMVESKGSDDTVELFCTRSCVMASKIQAVCASGITLNCDNCGKDSVPACHLTMSDSSIRNFCTLTCAMTFKENQKDKIGGPKQIQSDFHQPMGNLPCAQCQCLITTTPKIIQKKDKIYFVCSTACCQKFRRINNIKAMCEFCKNEGIIREAKRIEGRDCYFCSDGCKMLCCDVLDKEWGKHCRSCAYCHSISKTVVKAKCDDGEEEFCSEECSLNFKMLLCCVAKCDTCGCKGKLRQSLPMLGEVKHFCDLKCLLHFCNKTVQMVDTGSSPPDSSATVESSPVIANVMSLAGALTRRSSVSSSTAQRGFSPDIQTKVIGHASIQTIPKEVKNKSMLCTPLVHNKGVSCTTQTVDMEVQTETFVPKVVALPVPVPVYVPLPMNMYSQYTPKPLGLPLPLPVPVFLPVTLGSSEPKDVEDSIQPETVEEKLKSEMDTDQNNSNGREDESDRVVTRGGGGQETQALTDASSCSHDLDKDLDSFNNEEGPSPDTSLRSHSQPHSHEKPPTVSDSSVPSEPQPELPHSVPPHSQTSQSPSSAPPLVHQSLEKVHNKNMGHKLQPSSKTSKEDTTQKHISKATSSKQQKLKSQRGIEAWRRWIQWKESQTTADPGSAHALKLKENLLHCSASELNDGLCRFIRDMKGRDGEPYSPDSLFILCLSIQKYLCENGRMENIFSDPIYNKFSTDFTKILKRYKPSVRGRGYVPSRVREDYLWDCKQLGAYSPIVLLNTLLFFFCKYFGFTTVEQHRQLSFARITLCTKTSSNNTKTSFLRFCRPISTNEAESDSDGVPAKKRKKNENKEDSLEMMENAENPLRCPVRLYQFYLSKCSDSVKQHSNFFYLCPDRDCVPSSPLWFSSTPLDHSIMEATLVRILTVREMHGED